MRYSLHFPVETPVTQIGTAQKYCAYSADAERPNLRTTGVELRDASERALYDRLQLVLCARMGSTVIMP